MARRPRSRRKRLSPAEARAKAKLDPWGREAEQSWRQNRPRMVADLESRGLLYQKLLQAQRNADDTAERQQLALERQGWNPGLAYLEAVRVAKETWLLLPSEEDAPDLSQGIRPYE